MKTWIQKIKGKNVVRFKHGNQIFTIQDYNGYSSYKDAEWMQNCLDRMFESYDKSVIANYLKSIEKGRDERSE